MTALNRIEEALEITNRMIEARAAAQQILAKKYWTIVQPWKDSIREMMAATGKGPVEVCCDILKDSTSGMLMLEVLAATLEVIEEDARK
jgi:hypothetical protein